MLLQCDEQYEEQIRQYIGDRYSECLYLYLDFLKYGLSSNTIRFYADIDQQNNIRCLLLQYHQGAHLFSTGMDFDIQVIKELIFKLAPTMICATKVLIEKMTPYLSGYVAEYGNVAEVTNVSVLQTSQVSRATKEDLEAIADLLCADEGLGGSYTVDTMYQQLIERFESGFGRNYVFKQDVRVISHCATSAEIGGISITSSVVTSSEYRGQGLATQLLATLCRDLLEENKRVFSFFYTNSAMRMHEKVGFQVLHPWGKLTKVKDDDFLVH